MTRYDGVGRNQRALYVLISKPVWLNAIFVWWKRYAVEWYSCSDPRLTRKPIFISFCPFYPKSKNHAMSGFPTLHSIPAPGCRFEYRRRLCIVARQQESSMVHFWGTTPAFPPWHEIASSQILSPSHRSTLRFWVSIKSLNVLVIIQCINTDCTTVDNNLNVNKWRNCHKGTSSPRCCGLCHFTPWRE